MSDSVHCPVLTFFALLDESTVQCTIQASRDVDVANTSVSYKRGQGTEHEPALMEVDKLIAEDQDGESMDESKEYQDSEFEESDRDIDGEVGCVFAFLKIV